MKLTLRERWVWLTFNVGLFCDRLRLSFEWNPFGVRHRWWGYLLDVENPETATRSDVEARARFLRGLVGRPREEIIAAAIEASYQVHIEPQIRNLEAEWKGEKSRARQVADAYRAARRAKGRYAPDPPEEGASA